jgi:uncharacterized repeat protein (TIGR02543 family)
VNVSPVDSGYRRGFPCFRVVRERQLGIADATPASGYAFSGWSGDATGSTNPKTLTMDGNKVVKAEFLPQIRAAPSGGCPHPERYRDDPLRLRGNWEPPFRRDRRGRLFILPQRAVLIGTYLYIADTNNTGSPPQHVDRRGDDFGGQREPLAARTAPTGTRLSSTAPLACDDGDRYLYVSCMVVTRSRGSASRLTPWI